MTWGEVIEGPAYLRSVLCHVVRVWQLDRKGIRGLAWQMLPWCLAWLIWLMVGASSWQNPSLQISSPKGEAQIGKIQ